MKSLKIKAQEAINYALGVECRKCKNFNGIGCSHPKVEECLTSVLPKWYEPIIQSESHEGRDSILRQKEEIEAIIRSQQKEIKRLYKLLAKAKEGKRILEMYVASLEECDGS